MASGGIALVETANHLTIPQAFPLVWAIPQRRLGVPTAATSKNFSEQLRSARIVALIAKPTKCRRTFATVRRKLIVPAAIVASKLCLLSHRQSFFYYIVTGLTNSFKLYKMLIY